MAAAGPWVIFRWLKPHSKWYSGYEIGGFFRNDGKTLTIDIFDAAQFRTSKEANQWKRDKKLRRGLIVRLDAFAKESKRDAAKYDVIDNRAIPKKGVSHLESEQDVLKSLAVAVEQRHQNEATIGQSIVNIAKKAAPFAAFALPVYLALRRGKKLSSKFSRPISSIEFAKALAQAKDGQEVVAAAAGLLNVVAGVFSSTSGLKDLGHRLQQVVESDKLKDFFNE